MSNIYWEEHFINRDDEMSTVKKFTIVSTPEIKAGPVGGYDITGNGGGDNSIMFMMPRKPSRFHRICTKFFLGWVWVDKKEK
jgi:hypothetical protein